MKHSILRICSATVLMMIGLALMLGVITAVTRAQEPQESWTRVRFYANGAQRIGIYDEKGHFYETVQTENSGEGTSSALPSGIYYAACADGLVRFELKRSGELFLTEGNAILSGKDLIFASSQSGTVHIERIAAQEWYDYYLVGEDVKRREVIRCEEGRALLCTLRALPYGTYTLEENGVRVCTLSLSEKQPTVTVKLP